MVTRLRTFVAVAAAAMAVGAAAPSGAAEAGVKAGYLQCRVQGSVSFIFGSSRPVNCTYRPESGGRVDRYGGEIKKFGIDIGYTQSGVIMWAVLAPSTDVGPGALAGEYGGGTAGVAAVYGIGANALVGGSGRSFVLQPLSIEGIQGVNIAAGVGLLSLRAR